MEITDYWMPIWSYYSSIAHLVAYQWMSFNKYHLVSLPGLATSIFVSSEKDFARLGGKLLLNARDNIAYNKHNI